MSAYLRPVALKGVPECPYLGSTGPLTAPIFECQIVTVDAGVARCAQRTSIADVYNRGVGVKCNAIWLANSVIHDKDRPRSCIVPIAGRRELRRGVREF